MSGIPSKAVQRSGDEIRIKCDICKKTVCVPIGCQGKIELIQKYSKMHPVWKSTFDSFIDHWECDKC